MRHPPLGQAAVEYVALLALVAVALAGTATVALPPGLGERVVAATRRALCVVTGGDCDIGAASCVVAARRETDSGELDAGFLRVGSSDTLLREERADGTVALTLLHTAAGGVQAGVGADARLRLGGNGLVVGNELRAAAIAAAGGGATYVTAGRAAAADLERRLRESVLARRPETSIPNPVGGLPVLARPMPRLPAPAETFHERGRSFSLDGAIGWKGLKASGRVAAAETTGERVDARTGWRTEYLRVEPALAGSATALGFGAQGGASRRELYAVTLDRDGRPLELTVVGATELAAGARVPAVAGALAPSGRARLLELDEHLDLRDPGSLRVARDFLRAALAGVPGADAAAALRRRLAVAGSAESHVYVLGGSDRGIGGHLAAGLRLGGDVGSRVATAELVAARRRGPEGGWREQADCLAAEVVRDRSIRR